VIFRRLLSIALTVLLAMAAWWLLRPADWAHHGAALEPSHLTLRPGEQRVVRLINQEADVVALRFRLRFDASMVAIDGATPEHESILAAGTAINLPARRQPGVVEVPGVALVGERVFEPNAPVYRFTVRGLGTGTTALAIEDFTVVDLGDQRRGVSVSPCRVTIRAR
jgi:hypothetical protein